MTGTTGGLVYSKLPQLAKAFPLEVALIVMETAQAVAAEAQASMRLPKTGVFYRVSRTGAKHQASAPGEAPAIDTEALVDSIGVRRVNKTHAIVYTNQEYAAALEFGRRDGKMAARPFLRPAIRKVRPMWLARLKALGSRVV